MVARRGRWGARIALGAAILLGGARSAGAESPEQLFDAANAAYVAGRFDEAAEGYATVLKYGVRDARVEYNLGNAEFRRHRLGPAILHFERAHRLDPTDADIRDNLAYASSTRFDIVPEEPIAAPLRWLRDAQDRLGPDRQALAGLVLAWLVAALLGWGLARPGRWRAAHGWVLAVLLVAAAVTATSWLVTEQRLYGKTLAVVLDASVEVLAGPGEANPTLFTVHEGLTVEVRDVRDEWVQVSLPNGLHGWVARDAVERV